MGMYVSYLRVGGVGEGVGMVWYAGSGGGEFRVSCFGFVVGRQAMGDEDEGENEGFRVSGSGFLVGEPAMIVGSWLAGSAGGVGSRRDAGAPRGSLSLVVLSSDF